MSSSTKASQNPFRPLQIINEERSKHGLRYADYARYRKHCAHKTHRLRSSLKLTHGKGREFRKMPPITAEGATDKHLSLLLFETERAWAHAQELSAPQDSRHSTSRYRRSHNYLSQLLTIARSPALGRPLSARSIIELLIYALIHTARLNLRRPSSSTAVYYGLDHPKRTGEQTMDSASSHPLVQLSVAYGLLDRLEKTAGTSKEVALARAFKDDIGPEVRWCVHEFGRGNDEGDGGDVELTRRVAKWKRREWDVEGIVADIAPAYAEVVVNGYAELVQRLESEGAAGKDTGEKKQVLEELVWEGEPVPVRNPELVDALLKVQDALRKLKSEDISTDELGAKAEKARTGHVNIAKYDGVLLALSDAADEARKIVEAQQLSGASASSAAIPGTRDIHFMFAYLTYLHLIHRIERDRLLLAALVSASSATADTATTATATTAAILRLLSSILQSLAAALSLPLADDAPALAPALAARLAHAKAQRALHLARAYAYVPHRRYAHALALTQRGVLHLREARSVLPSAAAASQLSVYPLDGAELDTLEKGLAAEAERIKREWFAYNGGAAVGDHPAADEGKHKKPLFFDIAFNYIEPPMERLRARAGMAPREEDAGAKAKVKAREEEDEEVTKEEEQAPPPKGYLTGLLGSWWGRK